MAVYYQRYRGSQATLRTYGLLQRAYQAAMLGGRRREAAAIRSIYFLLEREMLDLAIDSSAEATKLIQARIAGTSVRPSRPSSASGGLSRRIVSRPLPPPAGLPIGGFGIADVDELDKVINPLTPHHGPYWRAQEWGYAGHSKPVPGHFMPGSARPDPAQFRAHPYFQQKPYSRGMPALLIKRPIKARYFLRNGAEAAITSHLRRQSAVHAAAIARMRAV